MGLSSDQKNSVSLSFKPKLINQIIRSYFIERTLQKLPKSNDILDLCCGYGFYFILNPNAFGVDGDPECAFYVNNRFNKQIPLVNINNNLPFAKNSFSFVISHDVFEHFEIEQLTRIFSEIYRVLKPKGKLIVIVPNLKGFNLGIKLGIGHKTYITEREVNNLIPGLFEIYEHYSEPLSRFLGKFFAHNKEIFILIRK
jgi:SAM-dependent methyltransferase